jgi:hypothetical protein
MKAIFGLIAAAIGIYIGINLLNPVNDAVNSLTATTTTTAPVTTQAPSTGTSSLAFTVIIILVTVVLLGAVSFMGMHSGDESEEKKHKSKSRTVKVVIDLRTQLEEKSKKLEEYFNDLDLLLGITTKIMTYHSDALTLSNRVLEIDDNYDWYITSKNPDLAMFKVVGVHKMNSDIIKVYALGNNGSEPYLIELSNKFAVDESKKWMNKAKVNI